MQAVAANARDASHRQTVARDRRNASQVKILIATGVPRQREAGAAAVVLNHARELEKRGHQIDCWFLDDVLEQPARPKRLEALIFAARVSKRILHDKSKYDVVNIHAPWGCVYGKRRKMLGTKGTPPYVLTMQGSENRYSEMMRLEQRKGRAAHFGWTNRLWHRVYHQTMYGASIRTADYGAVANREAWISAELEYGVAPGKIQFVPNGVEEQFFMEHDYLPKSPVRLLYVGTWLDRKGIYYLRDGFQIAVQSGTAVSLTVAGCGKKEREIKDFFSTSTRDLIHVLPFVERERMSQVYADHDIFVFPSLAEGMPLTLLEAMAAGLPVVTTETSGMADVVEDGFDGLLVRPTDAGDLAQAIQRLCDNPKLRVQLGRQAQITMRRYTWDRAAEKLEKLFALAVAQKQD